MEKRHVVLTVEATYDLADIEEYIEKEFSAEYVTVFQRKTDELIGYLSNPVVSFGNTFLIYRGLYVYRIVLSPSIFFYVIIENVIHILRVLREEQNWEYIISKDIDYHYDN